ncbi:hypothetical protein PIIN_10511, partial [Serendipita indica DSM 11827]
MNLIISFYPFRACDYTVFMTQAESSDRFDSTDLLTTRRAYGELAMSNPNMATRHSDVARKSIECKTGLHVPGALTGSACWRGPVPLPAAGEPKLGVYYSSILQTLGGLAITCNDKTSLLKLVSYARRINQMKALEPEEIDIDELGFRRFGAIEDLERAVEKWQILVTLTPDSDPSKPGSLSNLGVALEIRFNRLGELVDLENAISNQRLAISLTTDGRPDKPSFFSNLGNALQTRFNRLGEMTDLEDAISSKRLAVSLTPDGHIEKPGFLNNLGTALNIRYSRLGELADL